MGRERQTENLRCIDLPVVSSAKNSWPWYKASYEGKLHVALLGFHTPCTVVYSTIWTQWMSLDILSFSSDRERGENCIWQNGYASTGAPMKVSPPPTPSTLADLMVCQCVVLIFPLEKTVTKLCNCSGEFFWRFADRVSQYNLSS